VKQLVLASNSPRRRELLNQIQIDYIVDPSNQEEVIDTTLTPDQLVVYLARGKAFDVANRHPNSLILAADTLVVFDKHYLGKPKDANEAEEMLQILSGKTHRVMTGVVLMDTETGKKVETVETTYVTMGSMSKEDLQWYIKSGEPFGKAGAYAIQGLAARFIEKVEGCYYNVIGLPIYRVLHLLKEIEQ
jgi:septum formation protein